MENNTLAKRNTLPSVRVLAAGCTVGWTVMQTELAKKTFDFVWYGIHIDAYIPLNALLGLGMILFGAWTGGKALTKIKGNDGD